MAKNFWKIAAEKIAKGLGSKTIGELGAGRRFFARAGGVMGVGFMAFELFKSYKDNIENEPAYKEMVILQHEFEKWGSAVSCIGREPFRNEQYGDMNEGGAINALHKKKFLESKEIKPAEPEEAAILITRAIGYIKETENVIEDTEFEEKKCDLIDRLESLRQEITASEDYAPIQKELTEIAAILKPIESAYSSRIYDCSREIQKKAGSNAAWAALSMVTLGLVNKPKD
jgi:hypothetical protein